MRRCQVQMSGGRVQWNGLVPPGGSFWRLEQVADLLVVWRGVGRRLDQGNACGPGMDFSINIATSLAGLLGGIVVDEALQGDANARGLKLLLDVREKTHIQTPTGWCMNRSVLTKTPLGKLPGYDWAIAR